MKWPRLVLAFACALVGTFVAMPGAAATDAAALLHVTLTVDTETPYVQAQVLVTLRVMRSIGYQRSALSLPPRLSGVNANQAIVVHLNNRGSQEVVQRNGLRYLVIVRRYVLFPQSAGAVTVGPVTFQGRVVGPDGRLAFETAHSNSITLHVRPIPASFTGDVWLPAKSVHIYQGFNPDKSNLAIGSPVSRRLALTARGANSGELPEFKPSPGAGLQAHAFTPQRKESQIQTDLVATLEQQVSLVPTKTGAVRIPTIEVPWWNTVTDQQEIARFPGRTLMVTPAPADWGPSQSAHPPQRPADGSVLAKIAAAKSPGLLWIAVAIGALALAGLLGSLVLVSGRGWFRQSRPARSGWIRRRLRRQALLACAANEPAHAAHAILRLAATIDPFGGQRSLRQLAAEVPDPLRTELLTLNAAMYGPRQQAWHGQGLARALRRWASGRVQRENGAHRSELPLLHPLVSGRQAESNSRS